MLAHSSMPADVSPAILRGLRLATTTTFLPSMSAADMYGTRPLQMVRGPRFAAVDRLDVELIGVRVLLALDHLTHEELHAEHLRGQLRGTAAGRSRRLFGRPFFGAAAPSIAAAAFSFLSTEGTLM